jgi:plasmid maintenance system antidote protein VapI
MNTSKLPDEQRKILRALVSLDIRNAGQIAEDASISRPALMNAINGERGISSDALSRLINTLGLSRDWKLSKEKVHLWTVGADINSLREILNCMFIHSNLWTITKREGVEDYEAYSGFFIISHQSEKFKPGFIFPHAYPPYAIVKRDKFMLGRGNRKTVSPTDAEPIHPDMFDHCNWGESKERVYSPDHIENIENQLKPVFSGERIVTLDEIKQLLNLDNKNEVSWEDVTSFATSRGYSPDDVMRLISGT